MKEMYQAAPTSSFEDVRNSFESSTGKKIEDVFSEFSEKPINSASIAQVHVARLKSNGKKVAVKVQHPWLKEEVAIDTKMTEAFIDIGGLLFKDFQYRWLVDDMKANLPQELDFTIEQKNGTLMRDLFKDHPQVKIPKVYKEFSNHKILTMEFVQGKNIDDLENIKKQNLSPSEVSYLLGDCFA